MSPIARFDVNHAGIKQWATSDAMRQGLEDLASPIQDDAVRTTVAEAVDTGLMAASWKIEPLRLPDRWMVRIWNSARSEDDFPYPIVVEGGRRTRNGKHIEGLRILGRALANNSR